jgi:hypothetical protein
MHPPAAKDSCHDCSALDNELSRASEYYVNLVIRHDEMIRVGDPKVTALERLMFKAQRRRNAAARLLLAHRRSHEDHGKTRTAGQAVE